MRRQILEWLRSGAQPFAQIADGLSVTRAAVSQHLKILQDAALVRRSPVRDERSMKLIEPDSAQHRMVEQLVRRQFHASAGG